MKAVVMAGGEGSRLRPLTKDRPKPMVPMVNKPMISHILDLLKRHGITDVVMTTMYMADTIHDFFGDGSAWGMNIQYAVEEIPLGTAGSVKNAEALLGGDTFLVISGDALTDFDLSQLIAFHKEKQAKVTLTLYRVPTPLEYGVVITDDQNRITQFLEKPGWSEVISDQVNTGVYVIEPEVLDLIEPGQSVDWSNDVFPQFLTQPGSMYGFVADGYWTDVGNLNEYVRATGDLLSGRVNLEPLGQRWGENIWVGSDDVEIAPDAVLSGPIYLGAGVRVKGGVHIEGPTVIRNDTIVDSRASISHSIIWRGCYIGEDVRLEGTIVGRGCSIKSKAMLKEGSVVADGSIIHENAIIYENVRLWPKKEVDSGTRVHESIIWGSRVRRTLFGRFGISGVVNVDLTPEMAAKIGAATGAYFPKGSWITINRDVHRSSRMLKRAIIAGLPAAGVNVWDLASVPGPVARYYTSQTEAVAGINVRLSPFDQRVVDIHIFNGSGLDLSNAVERKIERIYFREDFRRAYMDEIGLIEYAPAVLPLYKKDFLAAVDKQAIIDRQYKVVVDYSYGTSSDILPELLHSLKVEQVPLNAHPSENKLAVLEAQFQAGLRQLGAITRVLGDVSFGAKLDVSGEKIFIVCSDGTLLSSMDTALVLAELIMRSHPGKRLVATVTMPTAVDEIAQRYGGSVIRCKYDLHDLMGKSQEPDVVLAMDGRGNFVVPEFHPSVDGMMALAQLLENLALQNATLRDVLNTLPSHWVGSVQVDTPWSHKGMVMRVLNETYKGENVQTMDGVKVFLGERRWVLMRPDADKAIFHIDVEGDNEEDVKNLLNTYKQKIEAIIQ